MVGSAIEKAAGDPDAEAELLSLHFFNSEDERSSLQMYVQTASAPQVAAMINPMLILAPPPLSLASGLPGRGGANAYFLPASSSLSSRLSTFPVALRGSSSRKTISRGTL